jgi:hypothetical protein
MYRSGRWKHKAPDYHLMSETEILRHFEREQKRYDKGFMGLDGDYYMYLTQFQIRHRSSGEMSYPDDMEVYREIVFPHLKEVEKKNADSMWITQRGAGKSTVVTGFLPLKTAIKFPGSKTIMTSESADTTRTNFSEKLKVAWEGMHPLFRPSLIDGRFPNEKDDKQYVKFGRRGGNNKSDTGSGSIIQSIETAQSPKSPTKLEGQGAKTVILDELFKHPYVADVRSKADPLVKFFSKKVGSIYYVGSLSDATAKGRENAVDLWTNARSYGIMPLFVDATWFNKEIEIYDDEGYKVLGKTVDVSRKNGSIDRAKAREAILRNRKALEKLPNKKPLMEYIMMYPLDINELMDITTDSWWMDDEVLMYKNQKKKIDEAKVKNDYSFIDRPATLYYENPEFAETQDKVNISYDVKREHAKFFIFEPPQYADLQGKTPKNYGVGIDTIPGNSEKEEGSDHVALVKCFDTNQYVAYYAERSNDMDRLAKMTIMLQRLYFDAPALVERNSLGALKLAYEHMGCMRLLAKNPKRFRPKGQKHIELGLHKGNNTAELRQMLRGYIGDNIYNMHLLRFFEEFLLFPFENTDLMDAMAMSEALHEDYKRIISRNELQQQMNPVVTRYVTGRDGVRRLEASRSAIQPDGTLDLLSLMKRK